MKKQDITQTFLKLGFIFGETFDFLTTKEKKKFSTILEDSDWRDTIENIIGKSKFGKEMKNDLIPLLERYRKINKDGEFDNAAEKAFLIGESIGYASHRCVTPDDFKDTMNILDKNVPMVTKMKQLSRHHDIPEVILESYKKNMLAEGDLISKQETKECVCPECGKYHSVKGKSCSLFRCPSCKVDLVEKGNEETAIFEAAMKVWKAKMKR